MKILLVNPPAEQNVVRRWRSTSEQSHYLWPPMELCFIAGVLKERGVDYDIVDCIAERIDFNELKKKVDENRPDVVIFMTGLETIQNDIEGIIELKKKDRKIACFGYFPSLFYKDILKKYEDLDIIIRGEPEEVVKELVDNEFQKLSKVKGIAYRKSGKVMVNPESGPVDVNKLPLPDKSKLKHELYHLPFPYKKHFTFIYASRGCPFRCIYCIQSFSNQNYRRRSVESIVDEIKNDIDVFNPRTIYFADDTFVIEPEWVEKFCEALVKNRIKTEWMCLARPEILNDKLLIKMKKAGCKRILLGVESGSKRILKYYRRVGSIKNLKETVNTMRKIGIESFAFFIVGSPIETKEDIQDSIDLAKEVNPDYITLNIFRMYPGTEIYSMLEKKGDVEFNLIPFNAEFKSTLSDQEVRNEMFRFYSSFYISRRWILSHLPMLLGNIRYTIKLVSEYLSWKKKGINFFDVKERGK